MQTQSGLVSVVIPTYNRATSVRAAIDSVLKQTYPRIEVIVIDDGSTDETYELLRPYQQEAKIVYLVQSNSGPAAARNHGIKMAHGEFIAFLDADDRWVPEKLAKQIPLFGTTEVVLVYSDMQFTGDKTGLYSTSLRGGYKRGRVLKELIKENFIPTSSVVVRSSALTESRLFMDDRRRMPVGEDYYLWLHLAQSADFEYIDEPLVEYSVHSGQISNNRLKSSKSLVALFTTLLTDSQFSEFRFQIFLRYLANILKSIYLSLIS